MYLKAYNPSCCNYYQRIKFGLTYHSVSFGIIFSFWWNRLRIFINCDMLHDSWSVVRMAIEFSGWMLQLRREQFFLTSPEFDFICLFINVCTFVCLRLSCQWTVIESRLLYTTFTERIRMTKWELTENCTETSTVIWTLYKFKIIRREIQWFIWGSVALNTGKMWLIIVV
jgi:hypothetical protein